MRVNEEVLQLHIVYKKPYLIVLLQVMQESVSGTASHTLNLNMQ